MNPKTYEIDVFTPDELLQPGGDLQPFKDPYPAEDGIYFSKTSANLIPFFDFESENVTNYALTTPASFPLGTLVDTEGYVWTTELLGQKLARFVPRGDLFKAFSVPLLALAAPGVIRVETEDRYIWFIAFIGNAVGCLDKQTGEVTAYADPLPGGFVAENTVDGSGIVWYSSTD